MRNFEISYIVENTVGGVRRVYEMGKNVEEVKNIFLNKMGVWKAQTIITCVKEVSTMVGVY